MPQYKHILTDFKDLRKVIGEITQSQPAKSRYQQQVEKMGYPLPLIEGGMSPGETDRLRKAYAGIKTMDPTKPPGKKLLAFMKKLSKDQLQDIAGAGINFLSLLAVSNLIRMGIKPEDIKYTKAEAKEDDFLKNLKKSNPKEYKKLMKFKGSSRPQRPKEVNEGVFSRIAVDIEHGDKPEKIAKKYKLDIKYVKQMFKDIEKVRKAENDPVKEGKYLTYSDLLLKKSRLVDQPKYNERAIAAVNKEIEKEMKKLGISEEILGEGEIGDVEKLMKKGMDAKQIGKKKGYSPRRIKALAGMMKLMKQLQQIEAYGAAPAGAISAISDMIDKRYNVSKIAKEMGLTPKIVTTIKKYIDDINDPKSDINTKYSKATQGESRSQRVKEEYEHAKQSPFKLKSQQYPRAIAISSDGFGKRHATVEDIITACDTFGMIIDKELQVEQIQKQLGKKGFISYKKSELEDVFEDRETERMILALESDVEDQEPIKYTQGEIAYAELHEREIEFLKPDGTKSVGPILKMSGKTYNVKDKFTGKSFTYKYSNKLEENKVDYEKSWTKPGQGLKSYKELTEASFSRALVNKAIKIAHKMSGNMTGAYKKIEKMKDGLADDPRVKAALQSANENVQEVSIGPATIRKDFPNVWAQKDDRMNSILMALVNAHGYNDNLKAYKNDKKKFVDDLKKIGKNDASLKKAGLSKKNIGEWISKEGARRRVKERDQRKSGSKKTLVQKVQAEEDNYEFNERNWKNWIPEGGDKEAYQKFFNAALKKFGVSSPAELEGDKKKKFFNYVDKNWKADHEEVDVHKSYKVDGRRKNFREKMRKLGYIKSRF